MRVAKSGNVYLMRLDHGDEIAETIQAWCLGQKIMNATIAGLGSIENPMLAHYSISTKRFSQRKLAGIYEITSLQGNVGQIDNGQPLVHLHVTLANEQMSAFGGHLVSGVCSATAEIVITPLETAFRKDFDDQAGLKIWNFDV